MMATTMKGLTISVIAMLFLTACAGTVARQIKENERDKSGQYDGRWQAKVAKGTSVQNIQNWRLTCGDMSHEFDFQVTDSNINLQSGAGKANAYVSSKGAFKIYLPLEGEASAGGTSDLSINNGDRQLILRGTLNGKQPVGYYTVGIAEFGYAGCTSKVTFTRL